MVAPTPIPNFNPFGRYLVFILKDSKQKWRIGLIPSFHFGHFWRVHSTTIYSNTNVNKFSGVDRWFCYSCLKFHAAKFIFHIYFFSFHNWKWRIWRVDSIPLRRSPRRFQGDLSKKNQIMKIFQDLTSWNRIAENLKPIQLIFSIELKWTENGGLVAASFISATFSQAISQSFIIVRTRKKNP